MTNSFIYSLVPLIVLGLSVPIALHLLNNKSIPGLKILGITVLTLTVWSMSYFLEISSLIPERKPVYFYLKEIVYAFTPSLYYSFVKQFTRKSIRKTVIPEWTVYVYPIVYILSLIVNFSNPYLFHIRLHSNGFVIYPEWSYYIIRSSGFLIGGGAILLLYKHLLKSTNHRKWESKVLLAITLIIYFSEILTVWGLFNYFIFSCALLLSSLAFVWAYTSKDLFSGLTIDRDSVVRSIEQGLLVYDLQGFLTDYNPAILTIFQISETELLKNPYYPFSYLNIDSEAIVSDKINIEKNISIHGIWYRVTISSIRDKKGKRVGSLFVFNNINDAQEVIHQLMIQQSKWAFHLSKTPLAYVEWNNFYEIVDWNKTSENVFGYLKDEVLGFSGLNPLAPHRFDRDFEELLKKVLDTLEPIHAIGALKTKSGKELYFDWFITPLLNSEGIPDGISALGIDVTEGQQAIRDVLSINKNLESLLWALPDGLLRMTHDGMIIDCRLPGGADSDLFISTTFKGKNITQCFESKVSELLIQSIKRSLESGDIITVEYSIDHYFFEARIVPADEKEIIALIRPVTERVLQAQGLKKTIDTLHRYSSYLGRIQEVGTDNIARLNRKYEPLFNNYLSVGKNIYNLSDGLITRVLEDKVWIFAVSSPELLEMGMKFDLSDTMESYIRDGADPYFFNGSETDIFIMDLYRPVKTYIGVPIIVDGNYFGSLSFFGHQIRENNYDEYEISIIKLMAKIIGIFISLQKEEQNRQSAERELFANRERYKGLIESQKDIIIRTDPYNRITYANQSFFDTFLISEPHGKNLFSLIRSRPGNIWAESILLTEVNPYRFSIQAQIKTAHEDWKWYQLEGVAIHNEEGEIVEIQTVARDIDQQVKDASLIRQSEERFRSLAVNSPDFIFIYEFRADGGGIIYHNRNSFLGHTPVSLTNIHLLPVLLHPEDVPAFMNNWSIFSRLSDAKTIDFRLMSQEGTWEWVQSRQRVLETNIDGSPKELLFTISVITERKKAEEQIRFQALMLNQVNSAIIANDLDGRIIYWNSYAEKMFGYSTEEAIGNSFVKLVVHPDKVAEYHEKIKSFFNSDAFETEFELVRRSGQNFPIWASLRWVKNTYDNIIAAVGIVVDQTERRKAQNELLRAKDEAEAATREKSNFLAVMSHEIRTPMNTVIGYADLLAQTVLSDEQIDYVQNVRNSGENLLSLINNILDFSKLEQGKMELALAPMNLLKSIEETIELFYPEARFKGIDLIAHYGPDLPTELIGDDTRFKQILTNFVGNAIKFTSEGYVCVYILNKSEESNDRTVNLEFIIEDTGIGIPDDKKDRLFKPFSQADQFTTRTYGGTGLGLVICDRLVRLMNGTISVKSKAGFGTQFIFNLIFEKSNTDTLPVFKYKILHKSSLLYLDPSESSQRIYPNLFKKWNFEVISTRQLKEAFSLLEERSDIRLIIINNSDAYVRPFCMRLRGKFNNIYIIILKDSTTSFNFKADEYLYDLLLLKPFRLSGILKKIHEQMGLNILSTDEPALKTVVLDHQLAERYPLNILVAEDHPVNQKMIQLILSKMGYQATIIENGVEAIEALQREQYDLIFMDMQMPVMDGLEATRRIRSDSERVGYPVIIAMTANALNEDRQKCLDAGMNDYLTKPIKLEQVKEALIRYGSR